MMFFRGARQRPRTRELAESPPRAFGVPSSAPDEARTELAVSQQNQPAKGAHVSRIVGPQADRSVVAVVPQARAGEPFVDSLASAERDGRQVPGIDPV